MVANCLQVLYKAANWLLYFKFMGLNMKIYQVEHECGSYDEHSVDTVCVTENMEQAVGIAYSIKRNKETYDIDIIVWEDSNFICRFFLFDPEEFRRPLKTMDNLLTEMRVKLEEHDKRCY